MATIGTSKPNKHPSIHPPKASCQYLGLYLFVTRYTFVLKRGRRNNNKNKTPATKNSQIQQHNIHISVLIMLFSFCSSFFVSVHSFIQSVSSVVCRSFKQSANEAGKQAGKKLAAAAAVKSNNSLVYNVYLKVLVAKVYLNWKR